MNTPITFDHNSSNPLKQPRYRHQNNVRISTQASSYFPLPSSVASWWKRCVVDHATFSKSNDTIDTPSSEIYDACLEMNWDLALHLCRTLPTTGSVLLLRYQEGDNLETPLYMACQNRPPLPLIQELLATWPDATVTKSRQGDIPIHIACRYDAHVSVVKALLECHPGTATHRTRFGTTPLVALWEPYCRILQMNSHRTSDILASLAAANPPLYRKCLIAQQAYAILTDLTVCVREKCQLEIFHHDGQFNDKWVITLELLKAVAAYRENFNVATIPTASTPHFVHAAVALKSTGCPIWVLFYVTVHYSDQYSMSDKTGRFPLHIAIGPENSLGAVKNAVQTSPQQHWKFLPKEYWAIRLSLYFNPKAVLQFDPNEPTGRYPLHTAIYYGHQWHHGIQLLVEAAPFVLHEIDPTIGVYPFQLAATIYANSNSSEGLDLIYELVRYDPTVIEIYRRKSQLQQGPTRHAKSSNEKKERRQHQWILLGSTVVALAIGIVLAAKVVSS